MFGNNNYLHSAHNFVQNSLILINVTRRLKAKGLYLPYQITVIGCHRTKVNVPHCPNLIQLGKPIIDLTILLKNRKLSDLEKCSCGWMNIRRVS